MWLAFRQKASRARACERTGTVGIENCRRTALHFHDSHRTPDIMPHGHMPIFHDRNGGARAMIVRHVIFGLRPPRLARIRGGAGDPLAARPRRHFAALVVRRTGALEASVADSATSSGVSSTFSGLGFSTHRLTAKNAFVGSLSLSSRESLR